jgi:SAM-dependent methyltransferase
MTVEETETAPSLGILGAVDDEHAIKTAVVRVALELAVVPAVAAGNHDVAAIAAATGCSPSGMGVLLDAMCALGLLRAADGGLELSATAEAYLVPDSPSYCGELFLRDLQAWDRFSDAVRTGRSRLDYGLAESARVWASWASHDLGGWPNDLPTYRSRWRGLGIGPASMPAARILDVGCGSALPTLALALDIPDATLTGLDSGPVIEVAARLAEKLGVGGRASFVAGDVTSLAGISGEFDIAFFGHVFKFLDRAEIVAGLGEARRLLAPNGRVVVAEIYLNPGDYGDLDGFLTAAWAFNIAPRGGIRTFAQYDAMLREAGFGPATRYESTTWLQAEVAAARS